MHPVTERFLLIERLDRIFLIGFACTCVVSLVLWIAARRYKIKWAQRCDWVAEFVLVLALAIYLYWRFFLAWKGIYYP